MSRSRLCRTASAERGCSSAFSTSTRSTAELRRYPLLERVSAPTVGDLDAPRRPAALARRCLTVIEADVLRSRVAQVRLDFSIGLGLLPLVAPTSTSPQSAEPNDRLAVVSVNWGGALD